MPAIITTVVCCVICALACYFTAQKVKQSKKQWQSNEKEACRWKQKESEAIKNLDSALNERDKVETQINLLEDTARRLREQADQSAEAYYEQCMETKKIQLAQDLKIEEDRFEKAKAEYERDYEEAMADMAEAAADYGIKAKQLVATIEDMKSKARAAIEASKRNMQEHDTIEFHRIQIPDSDLLEIEKLREILPYLRDKDTLNKVIYKIYYENPVNDLIGRVIGKKQGGIYKITNINNGMCYVGQAVKIGR